ncbi:MAG: PAC2 family protein [Micrococcales bacterium]|nr:PAC2 family protein [Micrococcales bacterium]
MGKSRRQSKLTIAVAAFAGWNDAGGAATDAITMMAEQREAIRFGLIDPEEYCDFQVSRPVARFNADGLRELRWPTTDLLESTLDEQNMIFICGVEPSFRWHEFCQEILDVLVERDVDQLFTLGALLADVPHTRPVPVQATSFSTALRDQLKLEESSYEGPAGILTALELAAWSELSLPTVALWAAVPHYVGGAPSPKAQLAMVKEVARLTGDSYFTTELEAAAEAWQKDVDQLAAEEDEIAQYVAKLEEAKDTLDSPDASGEAMAKEFERYLRRHQKDI